jgi:hypothetical protein
MAFFKEAPLKSIVRDRDAAQVNVDRLAIKLIETEAAVIATKSAAQQAALKGDNRGLDAAENAGAAALRRHATIVAAHAEASKMLTALSEQIATMTDQKARTATASEVSALAADLAQAGASFEIAVTELVTLTERASSIIYEAGGLRNYAASSKIEVPVAVGIIGELLNEHVKQVLAGSAPATLPSAEVPFVPEVKPETKTIFTMRAISWKQDGVLRTVQKYRDIELPPALAERALKLRAAVEIGDPARNPSTHNQWPGNPSEASCLSLDGDEPVTDATAVQEIVQHSAFQVVDRGKPYMARVAVDGAS